MSPTILGPILTFWKRIGYSNLIAYENANILSVEITKYIKDLKGGKIDIYVSNNGTATSHANCTWELITLGEMNGTPHVFATTGKYLYIKWVLWGNTTYKPEISEFKLKFNY